MWDDPALSLADFHDLLLERGFTEVGCSKSKVTLQGPNGGRMELPRQMAGRVFASHVERAARLLHISPEELLADADIEEPKAATGTSGPLTAAEGARLVFQSTTPPKPPTRPTLVPSPAEPEESPEHKQEPPRENPRRSTAPRTSHISAVLTVMAETGRAVNFDWITTACRRAGHTISRDQVRDACSALARDGQLIRVRRGVYRAGDLGPAAGRVDIRVHADQSTPARGERHANVSSLHPPHPEAASESHPDADTDDVPEEQDGLPSDSQEAWERLFGSDVAVSGPTLTAAAEWFAATDRLLQKMQQAS